MDAGFFVVGRLYSPKAVRRWLALWRTVRCAPESALRPPPLRSYALAAGLTRNQAAYSAGKNSRVKAVATTRPPMIATAIGPKNTLRDSGIIASTEASAVSTMGRKRRTVAPTIASH